MQLTIVNGNNEKVGDLELKDELFGGRVKSDLIWQAVVQENAGERRGTHATKTRAQVSGSGKKPWRQKGTGRARVGEIRNPLWRKGGTVFGPQPRSYAFDLPKKVRRGALRAALAQKVADLLVVAVDDGELHISYPLPASALCYFLAFLTAAAFDGFSTCRCGSGFRVMAFRTTT